MVEDDDNDFFLFRRACSSVFDGKPTIHREKDGTAARNFLLENPVKPRLIISDLKMPYMDGLQLLAWIRQTPNFKELPFVMLTSSKADQDVSNAQRLGADDYRVKPSEVQKLVEMVKELEERFVRV